MDTKIHLTAPSGDTVYEEPRFSLRVCSTEVTGAPGSRAVIIHRGAVVIIPIAPNGDLILIGNRRWQVGQRLLELPAGTIEPGELEADCAARELKEETGYEAATLIHFHSFYGLPGASTEVLHGYLATGLEEIGQALEAHEDIEVYRLSLADVRQAVLEGQIIDGKTLALLALYILRTEDQGESGAGF